MAHTTAQSAESHVACSLAKSLAPEDVRVGDYVAPLHETFEYPSFLWSDDAALVDRAQLVRIQFVAQGTGEPLKVQSVCLPFVLVKHPTRGVFPLDVRLCRLAKLDRRYATKAWRSLKKRTGKSKRGKRKKAK